MSLIVRLGSVRFQEILNDGCSKFDVVVEEVSTVFPPLPS